MHKTIKRLARALELLALLAALRTHKNDEAFLESTQSQMLLLRAKRLVDVLVDTDLDE